MDPFAVLGQKHNEAIARDIGHSALPGAPVQPYVARRRRVRRLVRMAWAFRTTAVRRPSPVRVRRAGATCEPAGG